jgi:predicted transcriptional regulator of viral defense system
VATQQTQSEAILELAHRNGGIVLTSEVKAQGLKRWALQDLVDAKKLFPVQRGIYITENGYADDFFLLQQRYPTGIYSHETALYLLGYSDRVPLHYTMTFPHGTSTGRMKTDNIHPVTVSGDYEKGVITVLRSGGTNIKVYKIERTLVDLLKPRYAPDMEQFIPAIRRFAAGKSKNLNELFDYAERAGVEDKIRDYIGVLL